MATGRCRSISATVAFNRNRPLPRAFAVSENGGSYQAWSRTPRDPADSPDPAVRVISGCEKFHQSHCRLYAVDRVVVYRPGS
jgi:serine protease Do